MTFKLIYFYVAIALLSIACNQKQSIDNVTEKVSPIDSIQYLFDTSKVKGAVYILDNKSGNIITNDSIWAVKGRLPASTFKITNSLIALETGVMESDSTMIYWDSVPRRMKQWDADLTLKQAFHKSCVPCYQEIARNIGSIRMNQYLDTLKYGNMIVDSNNIDLFWLEGDSKISQKEQVDFLNRFYHKQLPISERTHQIMKRMMIIEQNQNYTLSGKTGWALRNGKNNGWFVGYLETKDNVYFFATNISPIDQFDYKIFANNRKAITMESFKILGIID